MSTDYKDNNIWLMKGDCLERMKEIPDGTVDAIITDTPYGTTACKWDSVIPFEPMWEQLKRIIKPNGAIVLFGSQPFTSALIMSNVKMFKYCWVWDKQRGSNFQLAKKQPMKSAEDIIVFSHKQPVYIPQFREGKPYQTKSRKRSKTIEGLVATSSAANICTATICEDGKRYPLSIISFARDYSKIHPTQKPVALLEYLIRTYTNEGETVLDFTAGSGTTGIAAINTNRNAILIELDSNYCEIIKRRIAEAEKPKKNVFTGNNNAIKWLVRPTK